MDHFAKITEDSLIKWEELSERLRGVTGPAGITLANTKPYSMKTRGLTDLYFLLKKTYNRLLGDRSIPNDNEHDRFIGITKKGDKHDLLGYSFFIEKTLRMVIPQDIIDSGDPFALGMYDQEFSSIVIHSNGGIKLGYSHFIASTIVNSLIPQVRSPCIDLHVICKGYKEIANLPTDLSRLITNTAFLRALRTKVEVGITRRICVWIDIPGHIFMIVLDSTKASEISEIEHKIYSADSVDYMPGPGDINSKYLDDFRRLLRTCEIKGRITNLGKVISSKEIRVEYGGLVCVSLVTRATIYLSMVIDPISNPEIIRRFSRFDEGNILDAFLYRCLEEHLYTFLHRETMRGNIVMFSADKMYDNFVNIKNIKLIIEDGLTGRINKVFYEGVDKGFSIGDDLRESTCITTARFLPY